MHEESTLFWSEKWGTSPNCDAIALMASLNVVRVHSGGRWPVEGFTLADEQHELARHEERHRDRQDFAFILLTPDESTGLGCVYLLPLLPMLRRYSAPDELITQTTAAAAIATFWIRQDRQETPLASQVITPVDSWLRTEWLFDDYVFRVNEREHATIRALEECGFTIRFELQTDEAAAPYQFWSRTAG